MKRRLPVFGLAILLSGCASSKALHRAVAANDAAEVKRLIDGGAPLGALDDEGNGPLHLAASAGSTEIVSLLLRKGAMVDLRDRTGATPLYRACHAGRVDAARILLDHGAGPTVPNGLGLTPLMAAAMGGGVPVAELLASRGAAVEGASPAGLTPLFLAASHGRADVAAFLLERGAAVDAATSYGSTPFWAAARNGHLDVAKLLLERGAAVNARSRDGLTPLLAAATQGHAEILRWLLANGAEAGEIGGVFSTIATREAADLVVECAEGGRREARARELSATGDLPGAIAEFAKAREWCEARAVECERQREESLATRRGAQAKRIGSTLGVLLAPVGTEGMMMNARDRAKGEMRVQETRIASLDLSIEALRARAERCRASEASLRR